MSKIDENDRLRAGTLGTDPFADAVPMQRVGQAGNEKAPALEADPFAGLARATPAGPPADPNAPRTQGEAGGGDDGGFDPSVSTTPELAPDALYGLVGEIVKAVDPYTEAHAAGVLVQLLAALGCVVGRGPHFQVGPTIHRLILFVALVGSTARGRKGTSWDVVEACMRAVAPDFFGSRVCSGLVSGEGLIHLVRDAQYKQVPDEAGTGVTRELVEEGVEDKRCVVQEAELGRTLGQLGREANTLSAIVRDAWDGRDLASLSRNRPIRATAPHVCILGHVTSAELMRRLTDTESQNGFANRFLWVFVKRSKLLPSGSTLPEPMIADFQRRLRAVLDFSARVGRVQRDAAAEALWARLYDVLSDERVPGLLGAVTARAEPMTMRLACLYALADKSTVVRVPHLRAAVAVWRYAFESARMLWGESLGEATADDVARLVRDAGPQGMTKTELRDAFGRHQHRRVAAGIQALVSSGLARMLTRPSTGGRPAHALVWTGAPPLGAALDVVLSEPCALDSTPRIATEVAVDDTATRPTRADVITPVPESATEVAEQVDLFGRILAETNPHRHGEL